MLKRAHKPTIAVDIDDVLAANAEGFVKYSNKRWGTSLRPEDYDEHWAQVWQVEEEEAERRAIEYSTSGTISKFNRLQYADEILFSLSKDYKLVIVTSRRLIIAKETETWLKQHFGNLFEEIHYAGIWDEISKDRIKVTKAEVCRQVGAQYLIDDQLKYCEAAAQAGLRALLFGDYPWNQITNLPGGVSCAGQRLACGGGVL